MKLSWFTMLCLPLAACNSIPPAEEAFARGNALLDIGDREGAIEWYTIALEQNSKLVRAYNNRGLARAGLKEFEGAIQDYDACLALDPFPEALYNRGIALYRLGRKGEAIADFTQAMRLNPQYALAYAGRGLVFASGGDRQSALADFRKALEFAPPDWADRKSVEAEITRLSESK